MESAKKEAVEDTIARVKGHFKDIFADLVPGGSGDLMPGLVGDGNKGSKSNKNDATDEDTQSEVSSVASSVTSSQLRWGQHRLDNYGLDIHGRFGRGSCRFSPRLLLLITVC